MSNSEPADSHSPDEPAIHREQPAAPGGRRVISADSLLGNEQEVLIQNGEEFYRLRRTRAGKLILYK